MTLDWPLTPAPISSAFYVYNYIRLGQAAITAHCGHSAYQALKSAIHKLASELLDAAHCNFTLPISTVSAWMVMKKLQAMSFRSGEPKRHFDSILRMIERTALPKQTCFLNAFWKLVPTVNLWVQYHAK